ncbi:MAG TPA: FAD-dependent monooxygenase, partial [Nannocystis exedens]|nr:FAD-dependent monooxygenase [Nannocystis exedens]
MRVVGGVARDLACAGQCVQDTRVRLPVMVVGSENTSESGVYDVIIVGGRPAGASLAIWLGRAGIRVLIVDQANFPSPHPASAPFLLPHALAILDELGLQESVYARDTPKITSFVLEIGDYFRSILPFKSGLAGRDYFYTIDRFRFDGALWQALEGLPTVRSLEGTKVVELLKDEQGRVLGVTLDRGEGVHEEHRAGAVIGADGRFSTVARLVGAATTEERDDVQTTVYYDYWQSIKNYHDSGEVLAQIYSSCDGFSLLGMPTVDDQTIILV